MNASNASRKCTSAQKLINVLLETNEDNPGNFICSVLIAKNWQMCAGSQIDKKTAINRLQNGILFVNTENAVWANHLTLLKRELLNKLNSSIAPFSISDIRFKPAFPLRKFIKRKSSPLNIALTEEETELIKQYTAAVTDSELRQKLESISIVDKKWQKEKLQKGGGRCPVCSAVNEKKGICFACKLRMRAMRRMINVSQQNQTKTAGEIK